MELHPQDRERMHRMTGDTICHNRRTVLGFIDSGLNPEETNAGDREAAEMYAEGMRMHWSEALIPATRENRFGIALHLCKHCADIPGAPVALGGYGLPGYDSFGKALSM